MAWFSLLQTNRKKVKRSTYFIASIGFISSGFVVQLIYSNLELLKKFAEEYKNIFSLPIITIFATAIGIFLGNTLLRLRAENKERREIAILLINTIDAQIKSMGFINKYLTEFETQVLMSNNKAKLDDAIKSRDKIRVYFSQLSHDIYFETAFKKIGIYNEDDIDIISLYSTQKQQLLNYTNRLMIDFEQLKNQSPNILIFEIVKSSIVTTIFFGYLSLIEISKYYSSNKICVEQDNFEKSWIALLNQLNRNISLINKDLCEDFLKTINFVKDNYQEIFDNRNIKQIKPYYVCVITINIDIINKTLNTGRISNAILSSEKNIIAFGESEEMAKQSSQEKLKNILSDRMSSIYSNNDINQLMQKLDVKIKNISL